MYLITHRPISLFLRDKISSLILSTLLPPPPTHPSIHDARAINETLLIIMPVITRPTNLAEQQNLFRHPALSLHDRTTVNPRQKMGGSWRRGQRGPRVMAGV